MQVNGASPRLGEQGTVGYTLAHAFQLRCKGARGEVALFRALIRAFASIGADCIAREYHGSSYQVKFASQRGAGRAQARCELCDFVLIQYPHDAPSRARITWNQAKLTNKNLHLDYETAGRAASFKADLEQWDLLANRPAIRGASRQFNPPSDLLSRAVLPSVGSFGVFYPEGGAHSFAYFSADILNPFQNNASRRGTLYPDKKPSLRKIGGYEETVHACCLPIFEEELVANRIGTPIADLLRAGSSDLTAWLSSLLTALQREHPGSALPGELMHALEIAPEEELARAEPFVPARAVVVLRTGDTDIDFRPVRTRLDTETK